MAAPPPVEVSAYCVPFKWHRLEIVRPDCWTWRHLWKPGSHGRSDVIEWLFAALNSVEMAVIPIALYRFAKDDQQTPGREMIDGFLTARLGHMENVLANRTWLAESFSVADILMADVLRLVDSFGKLTPYPACRAYVERATARPAFIKAHADQIAYFKAAD